MGFLDFLRRRSPVEERVAAELEISLAATGVPDAARMARGIVSEAVKRCRQRYPGLPIDRAGFGDLFLSGAVQSETMDRALEVARAEGAREEDFRWWWNLTPLDREALVVADEIARPAVWMEEREAGESQEQALHGLGRAFPLYGDPTDPKGAEGDDGRLPYELKDRVNRWMEKQGLDREGFRRRAEEHSSINAFIRDEIRKGNL